MAKSMSRSAFPKCIRERDFSLIKSFYSFLQYQYGSQIDASLPALAEDEFNLLQSFNSLKDFTDYFYDVYVRDWTSCKTSVSCTQSQFDQDWDAAISELSASSAIDYADCEGEDDSYLMSAYDQSCTKGRHIRASRRSRSWLFQKKAFRTEKILKAREHKETRELNQKIKSTKKALLMSGKAPNEKEALEMAKNMVCLRPNVSFVRARFALVSYVEAKDNGKSKKIEEFEVFPYKKRVAKTFHEKHKPMKKCADYNKKLQEIRNITLKTPGHNRKEAKRSYNIKHSNAPAPTPVVPESTLNFAIHPAYHNAIARIVVENHSFSFKLDVPHATNVNILLSKYPINARLLSILCTLNR